MGTHRGIAGNFAGGTASLRRWAATGAAVVLLAASCGKITSSPVAPAAVDTGVASVRLEPAATVVAPGNEITVVVSVTDKNGLPVKDGTLVSLTNDAFGAIIPSTATTVDGKVQVKFRAGTTQGTATIKVNAGGATHVTTLKIQAGAAPPPTPDPPPPPGGGGGGEAIDLTKVIWVNGPDISRYPKTATLGAVHIRAPYNVCSESIRYPSNWPPMSNKAGYANANHLVFAKIGGKWYAGCWEALFPNTAACRPMETMRDGTTKFGPFGQVERDPFWTWRPQKGEQIGFMVTSWVRNSVPRGVTGRSNLVMTTWPW